MATQDHDTPPLPLLDLLLKLKEEGLPLGLDDYSLLFAALQRGFGLKDLAALRSICHALWIRTDEERRLFDYYFDQLMMPTTHFQISTTSASEPEEAEPKLSDSQAANEDLHTEMVPFEAATEDVIQAVRAPETEYSHLSAAYDFSDEYFPLTRQQMKRSWRYLRHVVGGEQSAELDIGETVQEVGRTGVFLEPIHQLRRKRVAHLLLLIDYGGSMVPFQMLAERLVQTLLSEGSTDGVRIYYFRNYPLDYLYCDTMDREYRSIQEVLGESRALWTGVLIFSDSGAARGNFSSERIAETEQFIKQLAQHFQHIAWLNPVPRIRWPGSSAGVLKRSVPMFDLENHGLDRAIDILCGRSSGNGRQQEAHQ